MVLSGAVAAGCGGGGATIATAPVPPDRLAVTLRAPGTPDFRVDLDCAVADREACAAIVAALIAAQEQEGCVARRDGGNASVEVTGTLSGKELDTVVERRTDCEIALYERIVAGAGL